MSTRLPTPMASAPPLPPSPMTTATIGVAQAGHHAEVARDGLGLAALLGADARVGARRVDEGDDRLAELLGQLHQPQRLAVALGVRHAEVARDLLLRVAALLVADDHDARAPRTGRGRPRSPASSPKQAVAVQLDEVVEEQAGCSRACAGAWGGARAGCAARPSGWRRSAGAAGPAAPRACAISSRARRASSSACSAAMRALELEQRLLEIKRVRHTPRDACRRRAASSSFATSSRLRVDATAARRAPRPPDVEQQDVHEDRHGARDARRRRGAAPPARSAPSPAGRGPGTRQASRLAAAVARPAPPVASALLEQAHLLGEHHPALVAVVDAAADQHGSRERRYGRGRLERLGEDRDLHGAVHVLEREERHAVAALGRGLLERRPRGRTACTRAPWPRLASSADDVTPSDSTTPLEACQRMAGDVEAEHLLLEGEALVVVPLGHRPRRRLGGARALAARPAAGRRTRPAPRRGRAAAAGPLSSASVALGQQMRAREPERVEGAGLDEALDHAPVDQAKIDPRAEVLERLERCRPPRAS